MGGKLSMDRKDNTRPRLSSRTRDDHDRSVMRLSRRSVLGAVGGGAIATGLRGGIGVSPARAQAPGGSITWAQGRYPLTFNPVDPIGALERWVWQLTSARLINFDVTGNMIPDLAETWEVSEDGLIYTFHLNRTAAWTDGTPVTAEDVAFTCTYAADIRTGSRYPDLFASVKGVKEYLSGGTSSISGIQAVDDHTVRFEFAEPFSPFLNSLAGNTGPYLLPAHILNTIPPDQFATADYNTNPVGRVAMGPFVIASAEKDQNVVFTRNDAYFKGAPKLDQIVFRVMQRDVALAALLTGEIDIAAIPGIQLAEMQQEDGITITVYPWNLWDGLVFNTSKEYLADPRVRQAVLHAIDRKTYTEQILGGLGTPWDSIFVQEQFVASNLVHFEYDPEKSKQLLSEAGWDASHEVEWKYYGGWSDFAPILQESLDRVGFKIKPLSMETEAWVDAYTKLDYEMSVTGGNGVLADPSELAGFFECGTNTLYCNAEVTELFAKGRSQTDPAERKQTYDRIQEIINRDVPVVVLWALNLAVGMTNRVKPTAYNNFDYLFFHTWSVED
ncbi:MAG: peptide/nickel transport system substrate-binding protein [Thermomicrobiales bacterium]|nr:peptide/nickel transport system substrate-binding protein [Thermomicrobiales bacterium]